MILNNPFLFFIRWVITMVMGRIISEQGGGVKIVRKFFYPPPLGYMVNSAKKKGAMIKRAFKKRRHGKTRYDIHSHPYENTLIVKSMYMSNVHYIYL